MSSLTVPDAQPSPATLGIVVGIATSGRPGILGETLRRITAQTLPPSRILVVYTKPGDVDDLPSLLPGVEFLTGSGGLCDKRNLILETVLHGKTAGAHDEALILFLDDDFLLAPDFLAVAEAAFRADPAMAAATGTLIADGINGPGFTLEDTERLFASAPPVDPSVPVARDVFNTYGCNMVFRLSLVHENSLRFDTELPFYAWYEDIDFSRRLGRYGATRKLRDARGIHMGVKAGRISGKRLGYSQVANPIYLWKKGTYPGSHMVSSICRNVTANMVRMWAPEPYVDRKGRAAGNIAAFVDLLRGKAHPTRILHMQ